MSTHWGSIQDKFDSITFAMAFETNQSHLEVESLINSLIRESVKQRGTARTRGNLLKAAESKVITPNSISLIRYLSFNERLACKYIEALGEWAGEDLVRELSDVLGFVLQCNKLRIKSIVFAIKQIGGSLAVRQLCFIVENGNLDFAEEALEGLSDLASIEFQESVEGVAIPGSRISEKILLLSEKNHEFRDRLAEIPEFIMLNTLKPAVARVDGTAIGYLGRDVLAGGLRVAEKALLEELLKWSERHYRKLITEEAEEVS